mgnify:FL=1
MKIGDLVRVKTDILGDKGEFIGKVGRVIKIEPKCEGEYATVLFDKGAEHSILNMYKDRRSFCFSVGELEEKL